MTSLVRSDDAADLAGCWFRRRRRLRGRGRPRHIRIEHIEILHTIAGVEQNYGVFRLEKLVLQQFAVGNQTRRALRGGEDSFYLGPMSSGFEDFGIGRAHRSSLAPL